MNTTQTLRCARRITALALLGWGQVWAQQGAIYTCTDAQGRRITADRPIAACIDRPQRELSNSGATLRVVPPTPTAAERDAERAREREAALARQRARDAIRRDQVLLNRYPDAATHNVERKKALAQTQAVVDAAEQRIAQLQAERKDLNEEMEFYRKDPSKAPARVRRAIEDNEQAQQNQRRVIAAQQDEQARINARFDAEAAHLKTLWAGAAAPPPPGATSRP
ncbi:MAG: DUF4124 domain-containing protein [Burkholderiaceae bacterium]